MQPIDKYLPEFEDPRKKPCFQHSDEWKRDFQRQLNEMRTLIDMAMFRLSTIEGQQSALSHKVHALKYCGSDE